jgi:CheY-like chemotaxis protein/anti-sigma regulatory factor (Ser/Thr protein kinase)
LALERVAGEPLRFLIVDDERINLLVLRAILEHDGHEVIQAANGAEAVDAFERARPDMVLMDIMMPVMDGYDATRRIKALAGRHFVPVIFLTALDDESALARCIEAGGDDFLTKPYNRVILQSKISALLRMRGLYRTLERQHAEILFHHQRLQQEQAVAERIFRKIVHRGCLDGPGLRYLVSPAALFNGDLLLAARRPFGGLLVMLGDFAGHGLPAAVGAIPVAELFYAMAAKGYSIAEIVSEVNRKLKATLPAELFLAACFIEIDASRRRLAVWNGGLPDVLIRPAPGGALRRLASTHLPLGVVGNDRLEAGVSFVDFSPGDRLYLYTDGVIEAHDTDGGRFGQERLEDCLAAAGAEPFDRLWDCLARFRGAAGQTDDVTLLELDTATFGGEDRDQDVPAALHTRPPAHWKLALDLQVDVLRQADPLPAFLQVVMELQGIYAHRERLYTILAELYTNALEHGLLGLDSSLKEGPEGFSAYFEARERALAALGAGSIRVEIEHRPEANGGRLTVHVRDSGPGFAGQVFPDSASNVTASGRGLALLRSLCKSVVVHAPGNHVEALYEWP